MRFSFFCLDDLFSLLNIDTILVKIEDVSEIFMSRNSYKNAISLHFAENV